LAASVVRDGCVSRVTRLLSRPPADWALRDVAPALELPRADDADAPAVA
jgi:hypothetical protein